MCTNSRIKAKKNQNFLKKCIKVTQRVKAICDFTLKKFSVVVKFKVRGND